MCMHAPWGGGHSSLGHFCPLAVVGERLGLMGAKPPVAGYLSRPQPLQGDEREGRRGFSYRVPAATGSAGPLRGSALLFGGLAERRRLPAVRPSCLFARPGRNAHPGSCLLAFRLCDGPGAPGLAGGDVRRGRCRPAALPRGPSRRTRWVEEAGPQ